MLSVIQADRDLFADIFHSDPRDDCPHNVATLAKLAAARLAATPPLQAQCERQRVALEFIESFAKVRSEDDSKVFARVNREALRTIMRRCTEALDTLAAPASLDGEKS